MKVINILLISFLLLIISCSSPEQMNENQPKNTYSGLAPSLKINGESTHPIVKAYRIAIGDLAGNIQYHQSGILKEELPCLYAGLVYGKPWTRDAAINVWNAYGLIDPEVSKNTLLAQIDRSEDQKIYIGGQYWDKMIWTIGAWNYYLYTGDKVFLNLAFEVSKNTILQLETDEFSMELGLFRGPAVYGDGVAAYPDVYATAEDEKYSGTFSGVFEWVNYNESRKFPHGYGMPMYAFSTNVVYYQAYVLLTEMAHALEISPDISWKDKAVALKEAINSQFWNSDKGNYNYLIDTFGGSDAQESMGISLALLFNVVPEDKIDEVISSTHIEPAGIPCLYPSFERYRFDEDSYGRHAGTVWPHIQGFWSLAALMNHHESAFLYEFEKLSAHAIRDFQFVEIYHPTKETSYGGLQEPYLADKTIWFCAERQSWSASAYLRMIFSGLAGMEFKENGILFHPFLPQGIQSMSLKGIQYRESVLDLTISGEGSGIVSFKVNGIDQENPMLPADLKGSVNISIVLGR